MSSKNLRFFCQLGFSSEIEVPQLGSARLGTFTARLEPENSSSGSSLVGVIKRYVLEISTVWRFSLI